MDLCLILDGNPASSEADNIWRDACQHSGNTLEVLKPDDSRYQTVLERLKLNTFPALVLDNRVLAVGIPTTEAAKKLLMDLAESGPG